MTVAAILSSTILMLLRRRGLVCLTFLGLALLTGSYLVITPSRYVAQASVLAKFGREYAIRNDANGSPIMPTNFSAEDIVSSVTEIMRVRSLAAEVVDQIGAQRLYPTLKSGDLPLNELAAVRFADDLTIAPIRRSNLIRLEFANGDPVVAAAALNAYVNAFQNKFLELYGENRIATYTAELLQTTDALDAATKSVTELAQDSNTYAPGQFDRLLAERDRLQQSYERVRACCSETEAAGQLARQLAEANQKLAVQNANLARLKEVQRRRDLAQEAVDSAQRRLQEARNARNLDDNHFTSVQIVEPATPPLRPARPGKLVKFLFGLVLSAASAVAIGLLFELTTRRFSTGTELRRAFPHLTILAEIPHGH